MDTLFRGWNSRAVISLDDLRVFTMVASSGSFSVTARALGMPKSSVSRGVSRLEAALGARLIQRTTRGMHLTESGAALQARCEGLVTSLGEAVDYVGGLGAAPRGELRVSAGFGFGLNVLSEMLPSFLERYPDVRVWLDLTSEPVDLIAERVDVAIRMGPMPDSGLVATRLGAIPRYLCASPAYIERRGMPLEPSDLEGHDLLDLPGTDGRPRSWWLRAAEGNEVEVEVRPRLTVNDPLSMHRLVLRGSGVARLSGYLAAPDLWHGRILRLMPAWEVPPVAVHVLFPSRRELSPTVRAFVDALKQEPELHRSWQLDPFSEDAQPIDR